MTDEEAAAIAARAEAATPGPWHVFEKWRVEVWDVHDGQIADIGYLGDAEAHEQVAMKADAAFVAHAREDIPALLAERVTLREIVRAVAHTPPAYREQPEEWYCVHCGANFIPSMGSGNEYDESVAYRRLRHSIACPVTKARAALGEGRQP